MKTLTMLEKFNLVIGIPIATTRARRLAKITENALSVFAFKKVRRREGMMIYEYTFESVDIQQAAFIGLMFDKIEGAFIAKETVKNQKDNGTGYKKL